MMIGMNKTNFAEHNFTFPPLFACFVCFRSNIQIKSHGQKILNRLDAGEDIFKDLFHAVATGKVVPDFCSSSRDSRPSAAKMEREYDNTTSRISRHFHKNTKHHEYDAIQPDKRVNTMEDEEDEKEHEWRFYNRQHGYSAVYAPARVQQQYILSGEEAVVALALCELSNANRRCRSSIVSMVKQEVTPPGMTWTARSCYSKPRYPKTYHYSKPAGYHPPMLWRSFF